MAKKPTYEELENRVNDLLAECRQNKQVKAELERNLRFTESMLSAIPTAIFFKDIHGRYQGCNAAFTDIMGVTEQELRGKTVHELWPSEHSEVYHQKDLDLIKHQTRQVYEFEVRDKNGKNRPVIFYKNVFHDEDGNVAGLVGGFVDITACKPIEDALHESEAKYRSIANRVPGMVYQFVLHPDGSFTVPFVSDRVFEYSGYKPETIMAQPDLFFKPIPAEDMELIQKQIDQSAKGLTDFSAEHRLVTPEGDLLWFHVKSRPRLLDNGVIIWDGISIDITERKHIEEALQKSEERYQAISELTSDYSYAYRVESDGQLAFEWIAGALERLSGFTLEELAAKGGWESLIYPKDMSIPSGQLKSLLSNQPETVEYRIVDKGGNLRWMRDIAKPVWDNEEDRLVRIYGAVQDFTEQRKAEEALKEAYDIINESPTAAFLWKNEAGWPVEFVTKNVKIIFGYTADEFISGRVSYEQVVYPQDLERVAKEVSTFSSEQGRRRFTHEPYRIITKDGSVKWVRDSTVIRRDEHGNITHYQGIVEDITEHREAERELTRYRKQLEKLVGERTRELEAAQEELIKREKLSVLGQITATVSHELRNPLAVIRSSSFYLQQRNDNQDEKIKKHIHRIENQVEICNAIVNDLLEYTRVRHSLTVEGEISLWLERILNDIPKAEGVKFEKDLADKLPSVNFDQERLRRVLVNLVNNAFQAIDERILTEKNDSYHPVIEVSSKATNAAVIIVVKDNGIGMDEETLKRAFEPLFTTKARGTGLGLANVLKIVEEHNGTIRLESKVHQGTRAIITLPAAVKDG